MNKKSTIVSELNSNYNHGKYRRAEIFWGKKDEERCAFFVGISRAKDKLLLTHVDRRQKPNGHSGFWNISRTPHEEFLGYAEAVLS